EQAVTFELADIDDRANVFLHARLAGVKDQFSLDDEAWLVVGAARKARILIVGPPNSVLSAFFDDTSTLEVATVTYLSPTELVKYTSRKPALNRGNTLLIFDPCAPSQEDEKPRANPFFIGSPPPQSKKPALETIVNPQTRGWMGKHPLMRYI